MKSLLKNLNKLELILNELEAQPINLKFDPFEIGRASCRERVLRLV